MHLGFDGKRAFHNSTGLGNYARNLIASFLKQYPQYEYTIFDTPKPLDLPYFNRSLTDSRAKFEVLRTSNLARNWGWGSKIKSRRIDLFHGLSNELPFDLKAGPAKSVVTLHDVIFKRFPQGYKSLDRFIYHQKTKHACKTADAIVATSQQTLADLRHWYPESEGKTVVIYQAADPAFQFRKRPEAVARILYKYDLVEKPYILCVSKLEQRKNHMLLLDAFRLIADEIQEDLVLVGGPGDTASEVSKRIAEFNGRVKWLGRVENDDLVNLYDGSSFTVFPSVFEGFGIPIVEALCRTKAVVAAADSCFEEIAGKGGCFFKPADSQDLGSKLAEVSRNATLKESLEAGAVVESARFSTDNQVLQLHNLYTELLSG